MQLSQGASLQINGKFRHPATLLEAQRSKKPLHRDGGRFPVFVYPQSDEVRTAFMWFFAQIRHESCEKPKGRMVLVVYHVAVGTYYNPLRQDLQKQTTRFGSSTQLTSLYFGAGAFVHRVRPCPSVM